MTKYAIIQNGIVENIIDADEAFIAQNNLEAIEVSEATGVPYIKGTIKNGKFLEPVRQQLPLGDMENNIPAPSFT